MKKKTGLLILLLITLAASVHGQTYQRFNRSLDLVIETTRYQLGPFRFYPRVQFREIGVDNNIYRQADIFDPITDFTFTFSPQLDTNILVGNSLILTFTWNPEYVYYYEQSQLRGFYNSYFANVRWQILTKFVLSGRFTDSNSQIRPWGEFTEKVNQSVRGYRASFFYEAPRNTNIGIWVIRYTYKYRDVIDPDRISDYALRLNRDEDQVILEFNHQIFTDSSFFVQGSYTEYAFEYTGIRNQDSYAYQLSSGVEFPILGDLRGRFSLGYKYLAPVVYGPKAFSGLIGDTALEYRRRRYNLRFTYLRDTPFSFYTNNIFYVLDRIGVGASLYATTFLRLDYDFSLGEGRYPEPILIRLPDESYQEIYRKDTYRTHSAYLVFRLYESTGIGIGLDYWERVSNIDPRRSSLFLGGYITYDF